MTEQLRQALSEADEALTGTLLARMQDVEAARATVRLKKAAQDLLAALDASATTARETLPEHFCVRCHHRWDSGPNVGLHEYCGDCHRAVQAALPSTAPPAPPATPDDYERGFQAGWNHSLHLLGPQQDVAPRRAETPTNRPPADAKEWTCDECGNDLLWCKHGRKAAALPLPSPAPPEGPRDAAPPQATCEWTEDSGVYWATTCGKLFTAGRLSESHYRFCPYCGLTLQPVVFDDAVSADGAPGGE